MKGYCGLSCRYSAVMSKLKQYKAPFYYSFIVVIAALFTAYFVMVIVPELLADQDIIAAFLAGFVNPYSTGYSLDVIACWLFLLAWVLHERRAFKVQHGWLALIIGIVPGVIVGLVAYTIIRLGQVQVRAVVDQPKK